MGKLVSEYSIYNAYDRSNYSVGAIWMLSIGIDDYGERKYRNCKSDAKSYLQYFKEQYENIFTQQIAASLFKGYLLLDKDATRDSILSVLKVISSKSSPNDYFIFAFAGQSNMFSNTSGDSNTYFFPFNVKGSIELPVNRNKLDTLNVSENLLSLKTFQEYIQFIGATNQLFITEAGPSAKFKTEFIKTLMNSSPDVASILNKIRVHIVPNDTGYDYSSCNPGKGPINYFITTLGKEYNIYDLFKNNYRAKEIAYALKSKAYNCIHANNEYFDVFFEREFLKQYKEIFGEQNEKTRGIRMTAKQQRLMRLKGRQYALVVGTDNYAVKEWPRLFNPFYDVNAVGEELKKNHTVFK